MIEEINSADIKLPEYESYCCKVRKGRSKRHWSDEWQNIYSGSLGTDEESLHKSVVHRKPMKRLFAHRYMWSLVECRIAECGERLQNWNNVKMHCNRHRCVGNVTKQQY